MVGQPYYYDRNGFLQYGTIIEIITTIDSAASSRKLNLDDWYACNREMDECRPHNFTPAVSHHPRFGWMAAKLSRLRLDVRDVPKTLPAPKTAPTRSQGPLVAWPTLLRTFR